MKSLIYFGATFLITITLMANKFAGNNETANEVQLSVPATIVGSDTIPTVNIPVVIIKGN